MTTAEQQTTAGTNRRQGIIAVAAVAAIGVSLLMRFMGPAGDVYGLPLHDLPLIAALVFGGLPLVLELLVKLLRREFGSDLLAGMSIVTSVVLGEYLAGALVVLMLSGGEALEGYAMRSASSVLRALARRMPSTAHRKGNGAVVDVALGNVAVGDTLVVFPHEICPVDGTVIEGHGAMDESYLTGEPYVMSKTPGSAVLSGAINGDKALTIRADKLAVDSRYAKIMQVMRASEQQRPRLRRLGDQLGAFYTPLALAIALVAWALSGDVLRFLAVLVVATPCPLLIAIPVAIIGSISLAARRGIIIKDPAVLEKVDTCRTAIFDKTGTLTYGRPKLTQFLAGPEWSEREVLTLVASLERYSKHPLSSAILDAAKEAGVTLLDASHVSEPPGEGLRGKVSGRTIQVTSRKKITAQIPEVAGDLPPPADGLECVIVIDDRYWNGTLGLLPPAQGSNTTLFLLGPSLDSGQQFGPSQLTREGQTLSIDVECWTDDGPRRRNVPSRQVYAVDLGTLEAGAYTLQVRWRGLFAKAKSARTLYHWNATRTAQVKFEVHAKDKAPDKGTVPALTDKDFQTEEIAAEKQRLFQSPWYTQRDLDQGAMVLVPKPGLRLGSLDLVAWLKTNPANIGDLPQLHQGKPMYALIQGPFLNAGEWLTLREIEWQDKHATLRVDVWRDDEARLQNLRHYPILLVPIYSAHAPLVPAGDYQVTVDWTLLRAPTNRAWYLTDNQPDALKLQTLLAERSRDKFSLK